MEHEKGVIEMRISIEVKLLRGGQARPYADSEYEAEIVFRNWWDSKTGEREGNWDPDEKRVREAARWFVCHFEDNPVSAMEPHLKSIEKLERGHWRVLVVEPYTD